LIEVVRVDKLGDKMRNKRVGDKSFDTPAWHSVLPAYNFSVTSVYCKAIISAFVKDITVTYLQSVFNIRSCYQILK